MLFLTLWERAHLVTCEYIVQLSYMFLGMHYVWNKGSPSVVNGWLNKDELGLWMQQHIDCFILQKSYNSKYLWLRSLCSDCYTLAKVIKIMTVQ
jgi:hypothetical protein